MLHRELLRVVNSHQAETWVLLEAMEWAKDKGWSQILFESDWRYISIQKCRVASSTVAFFFYLLCINLSKLVVLVC